MSEGSISKVEEIIGQEPQVVPPYALSILKKFLMMPEIKDLGNNRYQFDLDLGLEKLWKHLVYWSLATFFFTLMSYLLNHIKQTTGIFVSLGLAGFFALLYKFTNHYYILDLTRNKLYRGQYFLGIGREKVIANFTDFIALIVEATTSTTHSSGGQSHTTWSYRVTAIRKDYKRVPLSNFKSMAGITATNDYGEQLAELMNVTFYPGESNHYPVWDKNSALFEVTYQPRNSMYGNRLVGFVISALGFLLGLALLLGLWWGP